MTNEVTNTENQEQTTGITVGGEKVISRLTITDIAEQIGVTPKTIMRWEKSGKIKKPKRDWKGWRIYSEDDLAQIKSFVETVYEY